MLSPHLLQRLLSKFLSWNRLRPKASTVNSFSPRKMITITPDEVKGGKKKHWGIGSCSTNAWCFVLGDIPEMALKAAEKQLLHQHEW